MKQAAVIVKSSLRTMGKGDITRLLTMLRLGTKARAETQEDLELQNGLYVDLLRQYPADVVAHVLRTQLALSPFFPAWAELYPRLEKLARPRRLVHALLDAEIAKQERAA